MADVSRAAGWSGRRRAHMLLLFWILTAVRPSIPQPPVPLSLPVHMSVVPPPWHFLPLSQVELGPLFSNSSPFSFSQSVFMVPPPQGRAPRPGIQASFGPYSVTQPVEPVVGPQPVLSASVLSECVDREQDERGREVFRVRTLFHQQGDSSTRGTCITLHAFKDTEEHRGSCVPQPPLGLCVVSLTLPSHWFEDPHANTSHQDLDKRRRLIRSRRRAQRHGQHHQGNAGASPSLRYHSGVDGEVQRNVPGVLVNPWGPTRNQIQLYYSSMDTLNHSELTSPGCADDRAAHSQRQLFHIKAVALKEEEEDKRESGAKEEETCLNGQQKEELSVDSHVQIRYHRGPVLIGQPIRVSVNLRANFSAEFVVIRLKVKKGLVSMVAQRTLTSDLLTVTVERSQCTKHDTLSIICHKHSTIKHTHNPTVLQQVVCLSVQGQRRSFGVAMMVSADWWVEYSGRNNRLSPDEAAVSSFSFTDRHIFGITPITESNIIVNTAILTNQPVTLPVIVLAISFDGKPSDVTAAVTCHSANENTVKVSSDCSTLFVDGSESGLGNICAVVEFLLGTLSGTVCLEVWFPSVPLRISLADPVLNAIDGWDHFTENKCGPVYQRTSFQVLTQFTAKDSHGRNTYLLGSSDWFADVTDLVRNWLRVEDPQVVSLGPQNNLIGLRPGRTTLHVVSEQWDGVLGGCDITVTSDPVTPGDLSVQVVSGLGMSVSENPANPSIITTTVTAYNILYNHHQEACISVWLQFSDDSSCLLSSFSDLPFSLRLYSLAESVVVVTPGPSQHVFAQGDGGGPLLRAELLVSTCDSDKLLTSNSIGEGDSEEGGTRMLAGGSGWIRVNLDLSFLQPVGDKAEHGGEFDFGISDMLIESGRDMYASNFHEDESGNINGHFYGKTGGKTANRNWNEVGKGGMFAQNNLERAVLMPSLDEGALYFSRGSKGKDGGNEDEEEGKEGQEYRELEMGLGAVLSLLCVSALLFLVNCLPCALRDRRKKTVVQQERGRGLEEGGLQEGGLKRGGMEGRGLEGGAKEQRQEDGEGKETQDREAAVTKELEGEENIKQEEDNKEDVKKVEIVR